MSAKSTVKEMLMEAAEIIMRHHNARVDHYVCNGKRYDIYSEELKGLRDLHDAILAARRQVDNLFNE